MLPERIDAVVVGAGPAGLATSYELSRRNVAHVVLERGDQPGYSWANLHDSLTLHTGRHKTRLPGKALARRGPLFPPGSELLRYLHDYARDFDLPVVTCTEVTRVAREVSGWRVETAGGTLCALALVMAAGIISCPAVPEMRGRSDFTGPVLHSSQYRRPSDIAGRRVLVVGAGNSAADLAAELAGPGRAVDIAVRSGRNVVPLQLFGIPFQYLAYWLRRLPLGLQPRAADAFGRLVEWHRGPSPFPPAVTGPLDAIPLIGYHLIDAIRAGRVRVRPGVAAFTRDGAVFDDGAVASYDCIVLATGYRPALGPLGELVRRDAKGFALRSDRVASADQAGLWFVGHNYDATGGLVNISRDARLAANAVEAALHGMRASGAQRLPGACSVSRSP